ncbi:MAG: carbohydrate ABC transporter permease [Candidatus Parvarchaeum sp.]
MKFKIKRKYLPLLLILPLVAYLVGISFYPALSAVFQSFHSPSTGKLTLANFTALIHYGIVSAILNTALLTAGALTIEFTFGFLIATLLTKALRGKAIFSTIYILPFGIATVVSAYTFSLIFPAVGGYANSLLALFGIHAINWYSNAYMTLFTTMLADSWKTTPIVALILFAGMSQIPPELYNAAAVDGAGPIRRFFSITLPNIADFVTIALIVRGIAEFNIFALPLILFGYSPALLTTMTYEFYSTSSTLYYSLSSATILFAFVLGFALIVVFRKRLMGVYEVAD